MKTQRGTVANYDLATFHNKVVRENATRFAIMYPFQPKFFIKMSVYVG
jgi:hypothetical protein